MDILLLFRPTPTVAELRAAADQFCTLPWGTLEELYHVERGHSYTYPSQLPHRCLEALYIVTLLEKGFGFAPDSRSITFALEVSHIVRITLLLSGRLQL